ncbi:MAG: Phosphopantetheine-binding protein [Candidatus Uhrbacteria bacterium GW2011_GWE2_45_35]|uniref:Phosphopantetheine-binding protein n=2 Tax=Candidatus Uhriibacteriota TaxID=1752732 RepID=A0A0G1JJ25_9BACT|nr:MAG: Phosphopantetheine-binding protein [Candidatus Uhrbacteria bacterium GW2011_GWF2_44_350]KKU08650.1 MAG: Phosphopantetheine-binding protein [Candidatus Uhrbacteria bacterium GW2011_GWE2_45_35]
MTRQKLVVELIELICTTLHLEDDKDFKIIETTGLFTDIGIDSLDEADLAMAIEERFGISVRTDEIPKASETTVSNLVDLVMAKLATKTS